MTSILGLLSLGLFVALIVGMIKPGTILRWDKKPTRLKVFGYWVLATVLIGVLSTLSTSDEDQAKSSIEKAKSYIEEGKYDRAVSVLDGIQSDNPLYSEAQGLKIEADSLSKMSGEEKRLAKEAEEEKTIEDQRVSKKEQLERELKSVSDGVDFSTYRGTVEALQLELVLFGTWANIIKEGEAQEDKEINELASQLKSKVATLQVKEFPILRKEYTKIVANKMWENDIEVHANGTGNKYINFTGGIFAANKNKQDFQNQVHEALKMFRFSRSKYRWYKGEDEYTYWDIYEGKDSDLVTFDK